MINNINLLINWFTSPLQLIPSDLPKGLIDSINQSHYSKSLVVWKEEFQYLPKVLACCHHIQELTLMGELEFLPNEISQCHNLRKLSLRFNKYVPDAISQCKELKILCIEDTGLKSLPDEIGNCYNLQELSVKRSNLKHLPTTIGNCRKLTILAIENSELESIPDTVGNCYSLKELSLKRNKITYLPSSISNCHNLRKINIDHNQLEYLPEGVSNCTNLEFLSILGNPWKSIVDVTLSLSTNTNLKTKRLPSLIISQKNLLSAPSTNNKSSYDIVIVNPVCLGFGDYELGRKIQELVSRLEYSVKIQMIREIPKEKLNSRLIIITPYGFTKANDIQKYINATFCIQQSTKVLMIDEMDAVQQSQATMECYRKSLQKISIDTVEEVKIGFSVDSVGYLSMTHEECQQIQQRSRIELRKLFDSFNITFDPSANYYVSYVNSKEKVKAIEIFIFNTLRELQDNPSSVNYICSLGETATTSTIIDISNKFVQIPAESFSKDASEKFSKMNLMIVDVYTKKISQKELASIGNGSIPINVIFLSTMSMPKRVWHNFIAASKDGMMTGDQSLTDYLSIKQEMPFYETQGWKRHIKYNILKKAYDFKGTVFREYVATKFVTQEFSGAKYKVVDQAQLTDELRNNFRDFGRELARKAGNYACTKKIVELVPKKSTYSSTLDPIKKLFATV